MSTTDQPEPAAEHTRTRTPEQAAAWAKVEEERRSVGPRPHLGVSPAAVARVVIGVLVAAAALTAYVAMSSDVPGDRTDVLLLIGLVGGGAALAASALPRD